MTAMEALRNTCALTIAGSDSGGGAGIQADLKTFAAHGVHGLSAIAALTAQNTRGVTAVHAPPATFLKAQIDACFDDFEIGAVKIGMLANAAAIRVVADALARHKPPWVVLDPVMVATSGARLLDEKALDALRTRLIPLASVLTPNVPEAERLLGRAIVECCESESALVELMALGAPAVLLKGGHFPDAERVIDRLADGASRAVFRHPRLDLEAHGTGCTLASAIAAQLCKGATLLKACEQATDYVHGALLNSHRPARSNVALLDHFWQHRSKD
jgi:hydroxymethylpyrimidine/phosphomethylpyrimidine kinase